jgi:hypothetical protein
MMLVETFVSLLETGWQEAFARKSSLRRAVEQALAGACVFGDRMISRVICALGRGGQDWSADYKIYSRSPWNPDALFEPVIGAYLGRFPDGPIVMPLDDTVVKKTGLKIESATWLRDPMGPPFHTNLIRGLRFVQATLIFPLHREGNHSARSLPIRFSEAPPVKKPGKRAGEEERALYREAKKQFTLSRKGLEVIRSVRESLDAQEAYDRDLLVVGDGSYCNRTLFRADLERVAILARCRKDAALCFPAPPGSRRKYAATRFTPEQIRQDDSIPWKRAQVFYGGSRREIRYKEIAGVLWPRGALDRPLRLFVLAPQPYKPSPLSKTLYRDPVYLLGLGLESDAPTSIQAFLDRWQIECNHRDEKEIMGVGEAQVRAPRSVPRQPAFTVAVYSLLLLAGLLAFGPERTEDYIPLPKWRKRAKRPSALDLIAVLRKEIHETRAPGDERAAIYSNIAKFSHLYAFT